MTNESRLGFRPQPENTCPRIDTVIKALEGIERLAINYRSVDELDNAKNYLDEIDTLAAGLEDHLEWIRSNAEAIRDWGQQWKDRALELEDELDETHEEINRQAQSA